MELKKQPLLPPLFSWNCSEKVKKNGFPWSRKPIFLNRQISDKSLTFYSLAMIWSGT